MPGDDADRDELLDETASAARRAGRLSVAEGHLRELVARSAGGPAAVRDRYRAKLASVLLMAHQNAAALSRAGRRSMPDRTTPHRPWPSSSGSWRGRTSSSGEIRRRCAGAGAHSTRRRHGNAPIAVDALVTVGTGRYRAGDETRRPDRPACRHRRGACRGSADRGAPRAQQSRLAGGGGRSTPHPRDRTRGRRAGDADRDARLGGADGGARLLGRNRYRRLGLGAGDARALRRAADQRCVPHRPRR